jgi:hypothetical protein
MGTPLPAGGIVFPGTHNAQAGNYHALFFDNEGIAMGIHTDTLQRLYLAYFSRPADPVGCSTIAATLAGALILLSAAPASAALITSLNEGTLLAVPGVNYTGPGPQTLAEGITWSANTTAAKFGHTGVYGFGGNGTWLGLPMVGINDGPASKVMTFTFDNPVAAFGGFMNYLAGSGATIAAYDINNNLLEQFALGFSTGGGINTGRFYGFGYDSNLIASFTMRGGYIGGANFRVSVVEETELPEPGSLALLGLGLLGVAAAHRARRKVRQA